jgi:hypothetical protein
MFARSGGCLAIGASGGQGTSPRKPRAAEGRRTGSRPSPPSLPFWLALYNLQSLAATTVAPGPASDVVSRSVHEAELRQLQAQLESLTAAASSQHTSLTRDHERALSAAGTSMST